MTLVLSKDPDQKTEKIIEWFIPVCGEIPHTGISFTVTGTLNPHSGRDQDP